jgi:hypothetical protein
LLRVERMLPDHVRHWPKAHGAPPPSKESALTPELRAIVEDAVWDDTEALFELLGRPIASWHGFS